MSRLTHSMKEAALLLGIYQPLRAVRYAWNPPSWYIDERNETRFYRRFIRRGALCFDVGANVGRKATFFRLLGAKVVCVEPVPAAIDTLRRTFAEDSAVTVVPNAAGRSVGTADLRVGDSTTISSLSDEWIATAVGTERLAGRTWPEMITVPVTTLDALIDEFGLPSFCKIDVEGYEVEVLHGLSQALPALSFEFQPECAHLACLCIDHLMTLGSYEFNYSAHSPLRFELETWVGPTQIKEAVIDWGRRHNELWGDIYAKRRLPKGAAWRTRSTAAGR